MTARKAVHPVSKPRSARRLTALEMAALGELQYGAREELLRLTRDPSWLKLPLFRLVESLTNELDELATDSDSAMLSLETLDRIGAKLAMVRAAVVREGGTR